MATARGLRLFAPTLLNSVRGPLRCISIYHHHMLVNQSRSLAAAAWVNRALDHRWTSAHRFYSTSYVECMVYLKSEAEN